MENAFPSERDGKTEIQVMTFYPEKRLGLNERKSQAAIG